MNIDPVRLPLRPSARRRSQVMRFPWTLGLLLGICIGAVFYHGYTLATLKDDPPAALTAPGATVTADRQCADLPERFVMSRGPRGLDASTRSGEWFSLRGADLLVLSCFREVLVRVEAAWSDNPSPNNSATAGDEFWLVLKTALYEADKSAIEAEFATDLRGLHE